MSSEKKALYYLAKCEALSNAAEFIRSHGEEGFCFNDPSFDIEYKKQCKVIAKQLNSRADVFRIKYLETGILIDASVDESIY